MGQNRVKETLFHVIFGTQSRAGRWFDILLIATILSSVAAVVLDSIDSVHQQFGELLYLCEWGFTLLFTIEYAARIYCSPNPRQYAGSFYGVVDLLAIIPTYLALLYPPAASLAVVRMLRVLRVFRVLKLFRYMGEANVLFRSIMLARRKIFVFLFSLLITITIFGSLMFVVEGPEQGFTSIPKSIYWAIVTLTTVGYGDITPQTVIGQFIASLAMISGYAIIAVPTGIISAELVREIQRDTRIRRCANCERPGHDSDAEFCKYCGAPMPEPTPPSD